MKYKKDRNGERRKNKPRVLEEIKSLPFKKEQVIAFREAVMP